MEYIVTFDFNCINKRSMVSGKSGEVSINSDASIEELKQSEELIGLIAFEMKKKTKQSILSVYIKSIRLTGNI